MMRAILLAGCVAWLGWMAGCAAPAGEKATAGRQRAPSATAETAWLADQVPAAAAEDPPAPGGEHASGETPDAQALVGRYIPLIASADLEVRQAEQREFEDVCFRASAPGQDAERAALCRAMLNRLGGDTPAEARVWMLRQLALLGAGESVDGLAELLNDAEPRIRELARRALVKNPDKAAGDALRAALGRAVAGDRAWKRALVDALGARRETESVPALVAIVKSTSKPEYDATLQHAALSALGNVGTEEAIEALRLAHEGGRGAYRQLAARALLRAADGSREENPEPAAETYAHLFGTSDDVAVRAGAMRGLAATRGVAFRTKLIEIIRDDGADIALRGVATEEVARMPERATTTAVVDALTATASASAQGFLLRAIGDIGDAAAQPAVINILASTDSDDVRIAAAEALGVIGDKDAALRVAEVAGTTQRPVREALRRVLARLDAPGVDTALIEALRDTPTRTQVEALVALAARQCRRAVPDIIEQARHNEVAVRRAAFEALEALATQDEADDLVECLLETDDAVRPAALGAVVAACRKSATPAEQVAPVLARWDETSDAGKVALVQALGRLRGPAALDKLREARRYDDADVIDAAIRALADWDTAEVLPELLELARSAEQAKHRVFALRGYIRLLGEVEGYDEAGRIDLYRNALGLADRPEEKRMVLAGLANVADLDAARLAMAYREDEAVRAEAELAAAAIARLAGLTAPEAASEILAAITEDPANDAVKKAATDAQAFLREHEGYLTRWQVAGPFLYRGHGWAEVYEAEFSPERSGQPGVEWQPLPPTNRETPWVYDLTQFVPGGNRCVYVRTAVWSPARQPARLDIGSDDAVKAWLNGDLVHANKVSRGHTPFADKVLVTLREGWNTLMLKVVQASGGWGFSCRVQAVEGGPIEGLKYAETAW